MTRVTETDIAEATLRIAATQTNGIATFARLKREIPNFLYLSHQDTTQSTTRPNEPMWQQQIRNIKCHWNAEGNYINEGYLTHIPKVGYAITATGRARISRAA